jgi:asparagine synthase (glutamine-hydrolysing)
MSGICGIVVNGVQQSVTSADMSRMADSLGLSGNEHGAGVPLGQAGLGVCQARDYDGGIAQKHLHGSIVALAFHGRVYNQAELRSACTGPAADLTSVLLDLYLQDGINLVERLRGEFAVAVWDGRQDTCYLATDRFRAEPLFYYLNGRDFAFGSRMKGILASPFSLDHRIQPQSLVDVMAYSAICTPRTIFQHVKKLPPGHILSVREGISRLTAYWDINFLRPNDSDQSTLAQKLRDCLENAISIRLESDRPSSRIGAFLSGGIDSSTVTGILTRLTRAPVKSFSIGFQEDRFNEINYARIAAKHFGAEHYEYFVGPDDALDIIPVLLEACDEPFANASAIPTYACAKLAKQHGVDVLYAGDGGDELFAGNERYRTQRLFDYYTECPKWIRDWLVQPLVFWAADYVGAPLFVGAKKYIRRANIPYPQRLSSWGLFTIIPTADLFSGDLIDAVGRDYDPYSPNAFHYFHAPAKTELDRQLYVDLKLTISDNDLFKVTRMTQAAGVAVRYPFLDQWMAELAAAVPADVKMRGRQLRSFFKQSYADLLPEATRKKTKHGFGLPIPVWLRTDKRLNEMMLDLVLSPRSLQRGYFQKKALETLVERHRHDESSFYGTILWNVMILEMWHRRYLDGGSGRPHWSY